MFRLMDDRWSRREHFHHYMDNVRCTYSLVVQVDITALRQVLKLEGIKAYPAQIYLLANAVNRFPAFRMGLSEQGKPGCWEELHPSYTIFNPERETFSSIMTHYDADFRRFYQAWTDDIRRFTESARLFPQKNAPPNVFDISSVPWIDFSAFNLNAFSEGAHLSPIFTIGKYIEESGQTLMPLAMQLHHAACDGYHAGQFIDAVRNMAQDYRQWLT